MSNSRRQRRDRQKMVFLSAYPGGDKTTHMELSKDRHWILEHNYPHIRMVASKMPMESLVVCVVDHPEALACALGNQDAGTQYMKWRHSRGEYALTWLGVPWADSDAVMTDSHDWPKFKQLISQIGHQHYIPVVCISGVDRDEGG